MIKEYKLKTFIEEISMGPFGSDIKVDNYISEGIPVLNGSNLTSHKLVEGSFNYVSEEKADSLGKANAKRGDIVITHRGTLGQVAYIPQNSKFDRYIISQSQFRVRFNKNLDPVYFSYLMKSDYGQKRLLSFKNHVGVPALAQATTNFKELEVLIHEIADQQKIASILSAIDDKIELNNKINAELEGMAKLIYDYWFVQFDFPWYLSEVEGLNAQGKPADETSNPKDSVAERSRSQPYKSSGGKMVWNKELKREAPEGWKSGNIMEIADFFGGGTPKTTVPEYWNGKYNFYTPADYEESIFSLSTKEKITEKGLKNCSSKLFQKGTIFITARGSVGKINVASEPMAMNQSCYALFGKRDLGYPFIFQHVNELVNYIKAKAIGSIFNALVTNDFKFTKLPIPPDDLIKAYNEQALTLFEKILQNKKQNQELSSLRDWLLPMLMNGQVRVDDKYELNDSEIRMAAEPKEKYN